jgi:hypothetical protein
MANALVGQVAVLSVSVSILICALILFRRRKTEREPLPNTPAVPTKDEAARDVQPKASPMSAAAKSDDAVRPPPRANPIQAEPANVQINAIANSPPTAGAKPAEMIDAQAALMTEEDRNERILAGISENIRKSLQLRAVPSPSPVVYSESKPRNTEYVRVKREIITPHGHIRFSILKDWISTNMLAVFRRASLEWKTPEDLIALLPAYLEANAEILNDEILLIGTTGHNEKLAVPIRNLDAVRLRDCFDYISGGAAAANTPAVLLPVDAGFEVVSKGVVTRAAFTKAVEAGHPGTKGLGGTSAEPFQRKYSAALLSMECAGVTEGVSQQPLQ